MRRPSDHQASRRSPNPAITDPAYRLGRRPPNYGKTYPIEVLTAAEIQRLLDACGTRKEGVRNRALIVLLWRTGLRIAEAVALEPKDLDIHAGTLTVLRGKGKKRRVLGIDAQAIAELAPWIELRATLPIDEDTPLLCDVLGHWAGEPLHPSNARKALKTIRRRAGIRKRVHPHGLRHTHATELAEEDVPLHLIQLQLGHNSLATTERYITHLAPVALLRVMRHRPWPSGGSRDPAPPATHDASRLDRESG